LGSVKNIFLIFFLGGCRKTKRSQNNKHLFSPLSGVSLFSLIFWERAIIPKTLKNQTPMTPQNTKLYGKGTKSCPALCYHGFISFFNLKKNNQKTT